jgi:hypothetical protein
MNGAVVDVSDRWMDVCGRRSNTMTSGAWAGFGLRKPVNLDMGYSTLNAWTRRVPATVAELGFAIWTGHPELWNTNLKAFRECDVFPNWEVRSGQFYLQGEGDHGQPDSPDAVIVTVGVHGQMVTVDRWATAAEVIEHGMFQERTDTRNDHWTVHPMWLHYPDDARQMVDDYWASIPEVGSPAAMDQVAMKDRFWRDIMAVPLQEQLVADFILAMKRKPKAHQDQAVAWAEQVREGARFPTREELEADLMAAVP